MKKQILLLLVAILPMMASADDSGTCGDNLTWSYVEATHTLTISGEGSMANFNISSAPWISYRNDMTKAIIENGVTSIGDYTFYKCSGLTSITIPNSVTSIGDNAFSGCSGLASVHISDLAAWCNISFAYQESNPLYYAHHLYMNGKEVTNLVIPNGVTRIGNYVFLNCSGLISVTIPNSVTSIGFAAFGGCI